MIWAYITVAMDITFEHTSQYNRRVIGLYNDFVARKCETI